MNIYPLDPNGKNITPAPIVKGLRDHDINTISNDATMPATIEGHNDDVCDSYVVERHETLSDLVVILAKRPKRNNDGTAVMDDVDLYYRRSIPPPRNATTKKSNDIS